jgi:hypothetical protein
VLASQSLVEGVQAAAVGMGEEEDQQEEGNEPLLGEVGEVRLL